MFCHKRQNAVNNTMNFDPLYNKIKNESGQNPEKDITDSEKNKLDKDFHFLLRKSGDLNNDGKVDMDDILLMKDALDGKIELSEDELQCADINHDGIVDYKDFNLLINHVLESKKAEDRVYELQSTYDEMKMRRDKGQLSSHIDELRENTVKAELEQAIADFIIQNHNENQD